jgi:hypothetical protein
MPGYRFGRLPGSIPVGLHDLTFYAAGRLPKPPAKVDVPAVADWGMLANGPDPTSAMAPDGVGDCGPVGVIHGFMAAAADTSEHETFPSADQVVSYYLQYTGGQDTGVVLSDFLAYVHRNGFCGHTVAAYAPVKPHDLATLRFVINAYDYAYTGITVTQGMMDAFDAGQPWTLETLGSDELGGHCIILCGYDSNWLYGISWGKVVRIAYPAWHQMSDEAWALLSGELVTAGGDGHGLNLAALQADLTRIARRPPPQRSVPGPASMLSELASLVREVGASVDRDVSEVVAWLHQRGL